MINAQAGCAIRGAGVGLRACHFPGILTDWPRIPWFEVLADNYFGDGMAVTQLERVRAHYPVALHGVGLSIGSTDPLDLDYLRSLAELARRVEPAWISDHLAWTANGGLCLHELLPLPYTAESLAHVASRIDAVQEALGRRLLIENPSSYLTFHASEMPEEAFLGELVRRTGCELLLDVNNAYVSAINHGWDPLAYVQALPRASVREIHLAGYEEHDAYLFDTHGHRVHPPVWSLYAATLDLIGPVPTLIEWDTDIPPLAVLQAEAAQAQQLLDARS